MKLNGLEDLYLDQLKDIHNAEKQVLKALPKMAKAASAPELRRAFENHLEQTKSQVERLEGIFQKLGASPGRKKCVGMEGLIAEGDELLNEESVAKEVLDAGLVASAQKVEHYEISAYGTLRTFARRLGHNDQAAVLQQILDEEGQTDKLLTQLAERGINFAAEKKQ